MTGGAATSADPRPPRGLQTLNPLAKIAATLPAIVLLLFTRDFATPLVLLALAIVVLLAGAALSAHAVVAIVFGLPAAVVVLGLSFSLWADASRVDRSSIVIELGSWTLYGGALEVGLATSARLGAIAALALIPGLTTNGPDLARATVQRLRVPYRIGYTALAGFRFVPRLGHELDLIRQAHRVRGAGGGRGPFTAIVRWAGYPIPLLARSIRHAERVALAMDARAFGAFPTRTERHLVPFRARDVVFTLAFWAVSITILVLGFVAQTR